MTMGCSARALFDRQVKNRCISKTARTLLEDISTELRPCLDTERPKPFAPHGGIARATGLYASSALQDSPSSGTFLGGEKVSS